MKRIQFNVSGFNEIYLIRNVSYYAVDIKLSQNPTLMIYMKNTATMFLLRPFLKVKTFDLAVKVFTQ